MVENFSQRLDDLTKLMDASWKAVYERGCSSIEKISAKLVLLNPLGVLGRGYSITMVNGKALLSPSEVKDGTLIETVLHKGKLVSRVTQL